MGPIEEKVGEESGYTRVPSLFTHLGEVVRIQKRERK